VVTKIFEVGQNPADVYKRAVKWASKQGHTLEEDIPNERIKVKVERWDRMFISFTSTEWGTLVTVSFKGGKAEEAYHTLFRALSGIS